MIAIIDDGAKYIIDTLRRNGYKAYAVGGCVRDLLLGKTPEDYDVATSATPSEARGIFGESFTVPTGLKHGTVTVVRNGKNYEVTTFRKEGAYSDGRRPDEVRFVDDLKEDLARRDFTVNAMAYNDEEGLIDLYGGLSDLNDRLIRAVGEPEKRFEEDRLRILRAVRFASTLGFEIEKKTARAAENGSLSGVSAERIFSETTKLLLGENATEVLLAYPEIVFKAIPELKPCYKFEQHSKWHLYDVYEHIARSVGYIERDEVLRWTMLLHDIGKPDCFFTKDGEGHFYGHGDRSEEIARGILSRLKVPTAFRKEVLTLIKLHDCPISQKPYKIKTFLKDYGEKTLENLFKVKRADNAAQGTALALAENEKLKETEKIAESIIGGGECYSLDALAVNGKDLLSLGFEGKETGKTLDELLTKVIAGEIPNDREKLLALAAKKL